MASVKLSPLSRLGADILAFIVFLRYYLRVRAARWFRQFEHFKSLLVDLLYKKRGKYARPFLHSGVIGLVFVVITIGPVIFDQGQEPPPPETGQAILAANAFAADFYTQTADEVRRYRGGEILVHTVSEGEALSQIAQRYGLETTTVRWENDLREDATLKPGQTLRILPVDGVRHQVSRGETILSIAKKYGLDQAEAQVIVDYPFNEFLNNETFELATGQALMVPDGVKPDPAGQLSSRRTVASRLTPDAGAVSATGSFIWPATGRISQGYSFYHRAIDIANTGGGAVLAADSGEVLISGWVDNSGYGNRVLIDHGNGFQTLYAHFSVAQVRPGQRVNRGDVIGQMGSTGRSTGVHLHFEIRQGGVLINPLSFLQ